MSCGHALHSGCAQQYFTKFSTCGTCKKVAEPITKVLESQTVPKDDLFNKNEQLKLKLQQSKAAYDRLAHGYDQVFYLNRQLTTNNTSMVTRVRELETKNAVQAQTIVCITAEKKRTERQLLGQEKQIEALKLKVHEKTEQEALLQSTILGLETKVQDLERIIEMQKAHIGFLKAKAFELEIHENDNGIEYTRTEIVEEIVEENVAIEENVAEEIVEENFEENVEEIVEEINENPSSEVLRFTAKNKIAPLSMNGPARNGPVKPKDDCRKKIICCVRCMEDAVCDCCIRHCSDETRFWWEGICRSCAECFCPCLRD